MSVSEPVRVVLESDGTQVEDGEYFQTLPENTIFIVLRPGEAWAPAGEDIVTQGGDTSCCNNAGKSHFLPVFSCFDNSQDSL